VINEKNRIRINKEIEKVTLGTWSEDCHPSRLFVVIDRAEQILDSIGLHGKHCIGARFQTTFYMPLSLLYMNKSKRKTPSVLIEKTRDSWVLINIDPRISKPNSKLFISRDQERIAIQELKKKYSLL
jgi:hypothetical protein